MPRDARLRIRDIRTAIRTIQKHVAGLDQAAFEADELRRQAVYYNLMVIGEACDRLPEDMKDALRDIPWREIKDFRNVLAHAYFALRDEVVWRTVIDELPKLDSALAAFDDEAD